MHTIRDALHHEKEHPVALLRMIISSWSSHINTCKPFAFKPTRVREVLAETHSIIASGNTANYLTTTRSKAVQRGLRYAVRDGTDGEPVVVAKKSSATGKTYIIQLLAPARAPRRESAL